MKKFIFASLIILVATISFTVFATYWEPTNFTHSYLTTQVLAKDVIYYDSSSKVIRLGDGSTVGGIVVANASNLSSYQTIANMTNSVTTDTDTYPSNFAVNLETEHALESIATEITPDTGITPAGYIIIRVNGSNFKVMVSEQF